MKPIAPMQNPNQALLFPEQSILGPREGMRYLERMKEILKVKKAPNEKQTAKR